MKKILFVFLLLHSALYAEEQGVGFIEKTGSAVPLNAEFYDEDGKTVPLGDLIQTPVLLTLVYYRCPGICTPLLSGVAEAVRNMKLMPGKDYTIITISFDDTEDYELASEKKENYLNVLQKDFPPSAWRFLTGKKENLEKITSAVGFKFKKQGDEFIHPAGVIVLSRDGRIMRYLYGTTFLPFDFRLSILEASKGNVLTPLNRALRLCYKYDPQGRRYVFDVLKVSAIASLIVAGGFLVFLVVTSSRKDRGA
jgi:protein SCO1/2